MDMGDLWNATTTKAIAQSIVMGITILVIGAIILVRILRAPAGKRQLMEYNTYMELINEQKETNRELRDELSALKQKLDSIEKLLKEVE